jgi:hypothetical protein
MIYRNIQKKNCEGNCLFSNATLNNYNTCCGMAVDACISGKFTNRMAKNCEHFENIKEYTQFKGEFLADPLEDEPEERKPEKYLDYIR